MSFLKKMQERYTTKKYDAGYKIPQEVIDELKEILLLSPSSINSQPWHFTIISNEELKNKLAAHSQHNTEKVIDCSHLLVLQVLNNPDVFEEQLAAHNAAYMLTYFKNMRATLGDEKVLEWFTKQVYIALGVVLMACADLGVDSTPMEGIDNEAFTKVLGKENYNVVLAVAMGKHHPDHVNHPSKKPKERLSKTTVISELK